MRFTFALALLFIGLNSCTKDATAPAPVDLDKALTAAVIEAAPNGRFFHFILADENNLEYLPNQDPHNPITVEKVNLGKMLFFETGLAQDAKEESCYETYSCATCHIPSAGFLPGRKQGIADGAFGFGYLGDSRQIRPEYAETEIDAQGIRPLSTLNVAYVTNTLWSGLFGANDINVGTEHLWTGPLSKVNHEGFRGLESQNIEGLDLHRMSVNDHVLDDYGYRNLFDQAFPDISEEERYSATTVSFALGAYLRTLLTTQAPFQDWLKGDRDAMNDSQKRGALLFFGKARCYKCHNGPSFSSMNFHVLGTKDLYESEGLNTGPEEPRNLGRGLFTQNPDDYYRFKVPQLYNLKDYVSFFHGSSKLSLEAVLEFKNRGQSENSMVPQSRVSPLFQPLNLTQLEKEELLEFLREGLHDADVERYAPTQLPSGNCFPNNDMQSREELGCN